MVVVSSRRCSSTRNSQSSEHRNRKQTQQKAFKRAVLAFAPRRCAPSVSCPRPPFLRFVFPLIVGSAVIYLTVAGTARSRVSAPPVTPLPTSGGISRTVVSVHTAISISECPDTLAVLGLGPHELGSDGNVDALALDAIRSVA